MTVPVERRVVKFLDRMRRKLYISKTIIEVMMI